MGKEGRSTGDTSNQDNGKVSFDIGLTPQDSKEEGTISFDLKPNSKKRPAV